MTIIQMSVAGALAVAAIVLLRAVLMHKLPKTAFLALWVVVLVRLAVPFSVSSQMSVFNLLQRAEVQEYVPIPEAVAPQPPIVTSPSEIRLLMDWQQPRQFNMYHNFPANDAIAADIPQESTISRLLILYLSGAGISSAVFIGLYLKHRESFKESLPVKPEFMKKWRHMYCGRRKVDIRISDKITAPLTYGILRPVILLPKVMDWANDAEIKFVLAHEFHHIRRFDAATKLFATAILCVHWFNPLVWLMYMLLNRDLEISCDEAVVRSYGQSAKKGYALTLVGMAEQWSGLPSMCSNFSKHAIEERVKAIMKIRNKSIFASAMSVAIICATVLAFMTSAAVGNPSQFPEDNTQNQIEPLQIDEQIINVEYIVEYIPRFHGDYMELIEEPGEASIPLDEALEIGLSAIEHIFDTNLEGRNVQVFYLPYTPEQVVPSFRVPVGWSGDFTEVRHRYPNIRSAYVDSSGEIDEPQIIERVIPRRESEWMIAVFPEGEPMYRQVPGRPEGEYYRPHNEYSLRLNGETGEIVSVRHEPLALAATVRTVEERMEVSERLVFRSEEPRISLQQEMEFLRFSSRVVTELGINETPIQRISMQFYLYSVNLLLERTRIISVLVEYADGMFVELQFEGLTIEDKQLTSVTFLDTNFLQETARVW